MDRKKNTVFRNVAIAGIVILAIVGFSYFANDDRGFAEADTSVALAQLDAKNLKEAQIEDREQRLRLTLKNPVVPAEGAEATDKILAKYPERASQQVFDKVVAAQPDKYNTKVTQQSFLMQMASFLLPMLLLFGLLIFFMSRMQGGKGGLFGVGKSRAVEVTKDMPKTMFADVAGEDEAVEELNEIKDFLQNPARYERLGAKIPRGVLLYGPPGTGKTLLARAVAGEAGVPFYSISGSDFVEMFVGVGASRVRDLFEKAKQNSPCIVFVDEIDAVGRRRGSGTGGGHDEREQTLNQLLVEMDGFDDRETVILIAATNRPDVLDPALLRPGRFDRQVPVTNPDLKGREAILSVHSKGKPLASEVNLNSLAKRTIGMSGADLANVLNEGALLAARLGREEITNEILEEASDRVVGGPRRKHRVISEHEKKVTAYHESGHALAAWAMEDLEPVHKVTILARGRTGGHALVVPEDDKSLMTRADIIARIVMAMGGRAAEEYVFGEPTSGASSDIQQATNLARAMVTEYGMSTRLGAVKYGDDSGDVFLGRGGMRSAEYSDEMARAIDEEVRRIIDAAHTEAWSVLDDNRDILDAVAAELLEKETLRQEDLQRLFADVHKRPRITEFDDFGGRIPSTRPPIKTPGELAKERGEPWPPPSNDPFSLPSPVTAGRDGSEGANGAGGPEGPGTAPGSGPGMTPGGRPAAPGAGSDPGALPRYGTPPPPGWSAPGWPPAQQNQQAPHYQDRPQGAQQQYQSPQQQQSPQPQQYQQQPLGAPGAAPSGAETTRFPVAPQPGFSEGSTDPQRSDSAEASTPEDTTAEHRTPEHRTGEASTTGEKRSTRAWSEVDENGQPRSGIHRKRDSEDDR